MADIFNEVDEEVRRERLKAAWDKYGNLVVALAILAVLATAGWRVWAYYEGKRAAEAGGKFEQALELANKNQHAEAAAAFDKLAAEGSGGYRILARLREAAELGFTDVPAAVKEYDAIADDGGVPQHLRDLARVRAGMLLVDTAPLDEIRRRLEPLTAAGNVFRHTARETIALAAWRAGDAAALKQWTDMIAADAETPQTTRARVEMMKTVSATAKS